MKVIPFNMNQRRVCDAHGVWDVIPCPWPDCPQGIDAPQFAMRRIMEGESDTVFTRRELQSPFGGSYYTWDSDKMPNWFSVSKTFLNEARRWKLADRPFPETLYHYTSLEGLLGIIESRSLWLSDYSYLNDARELVHGLDIVCAEVEDLVANEKNDRVRDLLGSWTRSIQDSDNRVCVASLSSDGDSLSQWRAYGQVAIGFSTFGLATHAHESILCAVEYDLPTQKKLVRLFLKHLCQAYALDLQENRLERVPDVYHQMEKIIQLAASFKHAAFRTEEEFRLVYVESAETLKAFEHQPPPKHFRIARSSFVPYVSSRELPFSFGDTKPISIESVTLGPNSDTVLERGVKELLRARDLQDVHIRRSSVPLRN